MSTTIDLAARGFAPSTAPAANAAILAALTAELRGRRGVRLLLPPGRSEIAVPGALAALQRALSPAGVADPQPCAVPFPALRLEGIADLDLIGQDSTLAVHGLSTPISLVGCAGYRISGVAVDQVHQPILDGPILAADHESFLIADDPARWSALPDRCRLFFIYAYDPATRQPTPYWGATRRGGWAERTPHGWRIPHRALLREGPSIQPPTAGQLLAAQLDAGAGGYGHGIHLDECIDGELTDVVIHASMMSSVCVRGGHNLALLRTHARPSAGRLMAGHRDFLHSMSCSGLVSMSDCTVEAIGDDGFNVHIKLLDIIRRDGPTRIHARGRQPIDSLPERLHPGEVLQVLDHASLRRLAAARVASVAPSSLHPMALELTLVHPLPEDLPADAVLAPVDRIPRARITGCTFRGLRAHGGRFQVHGGEISGNRFENTLGPAIDINPAYAPGTWVEGPFCQDVRITGNTIIGCAQGFTNSGACGISVRGEPPAAGADSHRRLVISGNRITGVGDPCGILIACASEVQVRDNTITGCTEAVRVDARTTAGIALS